MDACCYVGLERPQEIVRAQQLGAMEHTQSDLESHE